MLALLWRRALPEGARGGGPRPRVGVDDVVGAAVALADADGLAAASMRRVAERLGVGTMSLYTHVPGHDELVALMVDDVAGERPLPEPAGTLRARAVQVAEQHWDELHRHPWLLDVDGSRPWIGPHASARYEWQLRALEGAGLTDVEMDRVVAVLVGLAAAAARTSVAARRARDRSGTSDEQWWQANGPLLAQVMPAADFPVSGRVGQAAGEAFGSITDPWGSLHLGLDLLLDGLEALLAGRR